jgi:hypothetical protein
MTDEFFRRHKIKYGDVPRCGIEECNKVIDVGEEYRCIYNSPHKKRYYCLNCAKEKNVTPTPIRRNHNG